MTDPNDPYGDPYNENESRHDGDGNEHQADDTPYGLSDPIDSAPHPSPPPPLQPPALGGMRCQSCQADLAGATLGGHCPQCGVPIVAADYHAGQSSGKATASLVLGIISIPSCLCCGLIGVVLGPLAIMFAKQAQRDIADGTASIGSAGMANAGFICGIIGTALGAISLLFSILGQVLPHIT